jgi:hypothetical protein
MIELHIMVLYLQNKLSKAFTLQVLQQSWQHFRCKRSGFFWKSGILHLEDVPSDTTLW